MRPLGIWEAARRTAVVRDAPHARPVRGEEGRRAPGGKEGRKDDTAHMAGRGRRGARPETPAAADPLDETRRTPASVRSAQARRLPDGPRDTQQVSP